MIPVRRSEKGNGSVGWPMAETASTGRASDLFAPSGVHAKYHALIAPQHDDSHKVLHGI
jgi:hypothetical protein